MPYDSQYGRSDSFRVAPPSDPIKQPESVVPYDPWPSTPWLSVTGGGGGGGGLYGQVTDGSGTTYTVQTFSAGPDGPPDDPPIQVTILQLDSSETIPTGTWIGPIATSTDDQGVTTGWCTVPVWLAGPSSSG